ncbi:GntR family transcriptional regulator [Puniceicoccus vermicola]|uniref:GntR family transcriptional regulator n=1 Tax=Puniceicoccus vermicola TaxID=388746 RepID=A0A7X1E4V8_9BACT|nr:GntR family transcriptional regulator [Puniceicoccus vermicola]MBC2602945.1 GntR family transcriptional regulator [Puniceicoccus vermicola]
MKDHPASKIKIDANEPTYRQVTEQVRGLILSGDLPVGSRLPAVRDLANDIGTSVFSIQEALAPLAREGLIERIPWRGTFVLGNKIRLTSVGLYFGTLLSTGGAFFQALCTQLYQQLESRGIEVHLIMDNRHRSEQSKPFPKLVRAIQNNEIQAVIGAMLSSDHISWLPQLGVPTSMMTPKDHTQAVHFDFDDLCRQALQQLKKRGAHTVANLPGPLESTSSVNESFDKIARSLDLEPITPASIEDEQYLQGPRDEIGYHAFHRLWKQPRKPEGILIFPDNMVPGVCMAIKELQIDVPEELKIVIHRNKGVGLLCPIPVDSVVFNGEELARELIAKLDQQHAGESVTNVRIPMILRTGDY